MIGPHPHNSPQWIALSIDRFCRRHCRRHWTEDQNTPEIVSSGSLVTKKIASLGKTYQHRRRRLLIMFHSRLVMNWKRLKPLLLEAINHIWNIKLWETLCMYEESRTKLRCGQFYVHHVRITFSIQRSSFNRKITAANFVTQKVIGKYRFVSLTAGCSLKLKDEMNYMWKRRESWWIAYTLRYPVRSGNVVYEVFFMNAASSNVGIVRTL